MKCDERTGTGRCFRRDEHGCSRGLNEDDEMSVIGLKPICLLSEKEVWYDKEDTDVKLCSGCGEAGKSDQQAL
jgi:hypothetical protein